MLMSSPHSESTSPDDPSHSGSRSGPDPGPSSSRTEEGPSGRNKRSKSGCLTCRLRKKRCDETRPVCAMCTRLGLECLGFSSRRPDWTRKQEVVSDVIAGMKRNVSATNSAKMHAYWSHRAAKRFAVESEEAPSLSIGEEIPSATPVWETPGVLIHDLSDILSYPAPQAEMIDGDSPLVLPVYEGSNPNVPDALPQTVAATRSPSPPGPLVDPALLALLGLATPDQNRVDMGWFPLVPQPSTTLGTAFAVSPGDMRYFHHYLTVIMPYQWIFERKVLSDMVAPLAFTNPVVFESLMALAALHMGNKRKRSRSIAQITLYTDTDNDLEFAERSLQRSIQNLRNVTFNQFGSREMIIAAMSVSSFHLFDGGNRRGWTEAVDLCRKCLAAVLHGCRDWNSEDPGCKLQLSALVERLGHLLSPLIWTDILTSVTEGVASQFVSVYRILLLDDQTEQMGELLRETVMGCDSTTRLAIAETIALSEWKDKAVEHGSLSFRDLMERAGAIERLLAQRRWRERHLFDSNHFPTLQRREVSNVFFHAARVLLAITVNGSFPGVMEVASAVRDTVDAFRSLDLLHLEGADRALVFPTVIAGCHADTPDLQYFFRDRFLRLGEEAVAFGNTRNALRLMEEVWRRREVAPVNQEVHWRKVMFELDPEGLLLI